MGVQSELDFSKVSNPLDSLSEGARRMLFIVLRIDKAFAQKNKPLKKSDGQTWEKPNTFLDELIAGGFLSLKSKRAAKNKTIPLLFSEELQAQKQEFYKTLRDAFGMQPLHIFEQDAQGALSLLDDLVQTTEITDVQNNKEVETQNVSETLFSTTKRLTLFRPADASETSGWFMHVPRHFNEALDIRIMERRKNTVPFLSWTQGSLFSFSKDDVLYKSPHSDRSNAPLIQILQASPVGKEPSGQRYKGHIRFRWYFSEEDSTVEMTQDDFVRFLISGPVEQPHIGRQ